MNSAYHLAQINIGRLLAPMEDPRIKDFTQALPAINLLAESSDGFIWRLKDETDNATSIQAFSDPLVIVNMSVWESLEALQNYAFQSGHAQYLRRRREWFEPMQTAHLALWWIPKGHKPTLEEAKERLRHLDTHGDSEFAFTFRKTFSAPTQP